VQCLTESGSLRGHFRWKQIAYRNVESKPVTIELVDEFNPTRFVRPEGIAQHPQRIPVL
jgi:hypothetical protein